MRRRRYVALSGAAFLSAVAGCNIRGEENGDDFSEASGEEGQDGTQDVETGETSPDPIEHRWSGSGTETVGFEQELLGPTILSAQYREEGDFGITVRNDADERLATPVDTTGPFRGAHIVAPSPGSVTLDIEADGDWFLSATQRPEISAEGRRAQLPRNASDDIPFYMGAINFEAPRLISWEMEAAPTNRIRLLDARGELVDWVVDEPGATDGSTVGDLSDGAGEMGYLDIDTDVGVEWSVTVEES